MSCKRYSSPRSTGHKGLVLLSFWLILFLLTCHVFCCFFFINIWKGNFFPALHTRIPISFSFDASIIVLFFLHSDAAMN